MPGIYTACLTITTELGCTSTFCDTLTLGVCAANFDYTTSGLTVDFQNLSFIDFGTITSFLWDAGDGNTLTAA